MASGVDARDRGTDKAEPIKRIAALFADVGERPYDPKTENATRPPDKRQLLLTETWLSILRL